MTIKKTYKVTFKGVIFPGFDKDLVIKNIHNITRIPEQTIARKFFSGKTVVIRHADSQEYADRLQKTFAKAGIETYIAELHDKKNIGESSELDNIYLHADSKSVPGPESKKVSSLKLIFTVIAISIIAILIGYFFLAEPESTKEIVKSNHHPVDSKIEHTKKSAAATSKKKIIKPPSSLIEAENVTLLIKVTGLQGLQNLTQFIHFSEFNTNVIDIFKQAVIADNSSLIISQEKPLYIFQTDNYSGLFISKENKLSNELITKIKNTINLHYSKNSCTQNRPVKLINTENHLFLSNTNAPDVIEKIKNLSNNNHLNKQFLKFNSLFAHTDNKSQVTFNFYYSDKEKLHNFSLAANEHSFWLNSTSDIIDNKLLPHLTIKNNQPDSLSTLKKLNLYQLALLFITQNKIDNLFTDTSHDISFKPETITTLTKNYSAKTLKDYQNNLDIEFNAQWQSGPFAITTNKFIFAKQLTIELLAKGQNIENLMEYSHTTTINTESVLNNKGDNILLENCADRQTNKSYFKNHDGKQEAYIDNDFISYTSISADHQITLEPGSKIPDIEQIKGTITLQLPDKLLNKTIAYNSEQQKIQQLEQFSIYFEVQDRKNRIQYNIMGDANLFITLRAYNKSGEILDSVLFKKKKIINNQVIAYHQEFSDEIDHITIFYTNKNNTLTYPFALKPVITPSTIPLDIQDKPEIAFIKTNNRNIPEFSSLKDSILKDNPVWLGENKAQEKLLPFYLSLFTRSETDNSHDAVVNIKSVLSPYISQNLSAVRLNLKDKQNTLIDKFVSFTASESIGGAPVVNSDGSITAPKITTYLNSNTAFQINKNNLNELHGNLIFNIPTAFKTYSSQYVPSGQSIKTDNLSVTLSQIDKHQIQFKIKGDIEKLVQLKLYNKHKKLISEPFEFKIIDKNIALITLRYSDKIDSIKLILSQESVVKKYIFSLTKQ